MNIMEFLKRGIQPQYVGWKDQYKAILYALGIDTEEDHIAVISRTNLAVHEAMKTEEERKETTRTIPIIFGHDYERLPIGRAEMSEDGCFIFRLTRPLSEIISSPDFELLFSSIVRRSATGERTIVAFSTYIPPADRAV